MNQSVIKALKLLDYFTEDTPEWTLKEIAIRAELPKPTAYRLLTSLEYCGFLRKIKQSEHDSRYQLGVKLLELGHRVADQIEIRKIAKPFMEQLGERLNEAIHLVTVEGGQAIYIDKVDSHRALRLCTKVGKRSPLYSGSGPKLLLAHLQEDEQATVLQTISHPFIDSSRVKAELKLIKEQGFALSEGEQDVDTTGVSYPIYDYQHSVVAAIAVSGLTSRFEGDNLLRIQEETRKTAQQISSALGYQIN
ncbi:IclR family transcriptional regulator [Pontibacillus litoralis]|uniref:Glycerol operon regulatory protein n=1 Tax=Pontibacillus litoralis JSM 072002 TaxID=1385512 RepID=A0A0A5HTG7_9BACI|nr:IclR family transcriptional regulator [Pontibacillus litoralis]KGX86917.1 IclR family transcriptional regulator [Pontibacillus litoralis JSM 072002]